MVLRDYTDKQSIDYNHDLGTLIVPTLGQIVHQNTAHCRAVTAMFILVHSEDRSCLCLKFLYLFFSLTLITLVHLLDNSCTFHMVTLE